MLRYLTAGESHGEALLAVIEGLPAGLFLKEKDINADLSRRQKGYGRGKRMKIESDNVRVLSGVRWGETTGAPVGLQISNRDYKNCLKLMSKIKADFDDSLVLIKPRPGHADLAGLLKFGRKDFRDVLERASARETAIRVGVGSVAKKLIAEFGIKIYSHIINIGGVSLKKSFDYQKINWSRIEKSPLRCADRNAEKRMKKLIDKAAKAGDTLGGIFQIVVKGCPPGLGSHASYDKKINARIAQAVSSIQAVKGVEFGGGFSVAGMAGSKAHDEIFYKKQEGFYRLTNTAGGFEGGMTNGEDLLIQAVMKPIASLSKPLRTVNLRNLSPDRAEIVRSDVCAVPACGIIGEAVVAWEIARVLKEKFGGDSMQEMKANFNNYIKMIKKLDFLPKGK